MPFPIPNLDDRSFEDLASEAIRVASAACPEWTDQTANDPMVALLEASAFLTDLLIYRVNRIPDKAYASFLNLIGAQIEPPAAAAVTLRFERKEGVAGDIEIPMGLKVASNGGEVEFTIVEAGTLPAAEETIDMHALHCTYIEGEVLGVSNGLPGQVFRLQHAPVIANTGDGLDLVIGVEQPVGEHTDDGRHRMYNERSFRLWGEVESFSPKYAKSDVFLCDRHDGTVAFAPAINSANAVEAGGAVANIPPAGQPIVAWYRTGGGVAGNVAAGQLTKLDALQDRLTVTNRQRAVGGREQETLENALLRGPMALRTMETAVTARDFERVALSSRVVARARAFSRAEVWQHGEPGTVEVHLVPHVDQTVSPNMKSLAETLEAHRTDAVVERVQSVVAKSAPIGVKTVMNWARVKPVSIELKVVCFREEDMAAVQARLETQIYETISPFDSRGFGVPLRASDIHEIVVREPGVRYVEQLLFKLDEAPHETCTKLRVDNFQPKTWYALGKNGVFRTLDDGESWCNILKLPPGNTPRDCEVSTTRPGWLAVVSEDEGGKSTLRISMDCGETWQGRSANFDFPINDIAWSASNGDPEVYLATPKGLFVFRPLSTDPPKRIVVMEGDDKFGYWAVASAPPIFGVSTLAVAAGERKGIWVSTTGARSGAFRLNGLKDKDIRVLAPQFSDGRAFLWAGFAAEAGEKGDGCARLELRGPDDDPEGWQMVSEGWKGGSCEEICFAGPHFFAGSNRAGVLKGASVHIADGWIAGQIDNGLPLRDSERLLHEVWGLAARLNEGAEPVVMAGGPVGVYRSIDAVMSFQNAARTVFEDRVVLPEGWLFASSVHKIEVMIEGRGEG